MLDLTKIQLIAQSYSPQELFAALVWQPQFNQFDGEEVITDLSHYPSLWASFLFAKPIFAPDENGLSFGGVKLNRVEQKAIANGIARSLFDKLLVLD